MGQHRPFGLRTSAGSSTVRTFVRCSDDRPAPKEPIVVNWLTDRQLRDALSRALGATWHGLWASLPGHAAVGMGFAILLVGVVGLVAVSVIFDVGSGLIGKRAAQEAVRRVERVGGLLVIGLVCLQFVFQHL
jgi:hypothetical protein